MLPTITQDSPLAAAVAGAIQPKLIEMGWSTDDGQESALIEYIVLMLVNGKTQEQIATELSNDFLGLEEGDTQALEFSKWLFGQVEILYAQMNGGRAEGKPQVPAVYMSNDGANGQDSEMGEAGDAIPTGPKAMRNGNGRGGRGMLSQINRNMDRQNDPLHRVRGQQGNGRIGGNGRDQMNRGGRGGRGGRHMPGMGMQGNMGGGPIMQMSPENQMQIMTMLEEQARMMSQLMPGFVPAVNPAFQNGQQGGRSLFDRVERQGQRGGDRGGRFNKRGQNQRPKDSLNVEGSKDTQMGGEQNENNTNSICHFNLRCTRADCPFAHQSPAAPEGISVDVTDTCSFGAACKNTKCTGRHPSPFVKSAHQAEEMCRFFPNCANPHCQFKHPGMPLCRNGADCKAEGCKFTHLQTSCKFNPCMNPACPYKHAEGQRDSSAGKVWTPKSAVRTAERKFVDDDAMEELVKPETTTTEGAQNGHDITV